jgi:SAM-dependent methyltransferase
MDQTAATVANLIRYRLPEYPRVLDVGCADGTLAGELPPSVHYLGIDASESVIEAAQSVWGGGDILFAAHDIREFDLTDNWDAIIFSEVLSHLGVHEAIAEVRRYAKALSPEGIVAISMMNNGKSRAIWRALRQEFRWIDGILWQQMEPWSSYRISVNREHPGYLAGVIGLRQSSEGRPVERELALDRRADQERAHHENLPGARFSKQTVRTGSISPTLLSSRSI